MLADLTWPEAGARAEAGGVLAIPVGATEQHGPHLPLSTDTDIAVALCERLAAAQPDVVVAPALSYGSSGEHEGFPGTLSIGQAALELLLVELGRSASLTFDRLLLVSAHGGNLGPVSRAVAQLRAESRDVHLFLPRWEGDPHAGRTETSLQLAISPDRVRPFDGVVGDDRPLADLLPTMAADGVRAVSASGVLGDPRGASRTQGLALLDQLAQTLISEVSAWRAGAGVTERSR